MNEVFVLYHKDLCLHFDPLTSGLIIPLRAESERFGAVVIQSEFKIETVKKIATCWTHGIPFIMVPPGLSGTELEEIRRRPHGVEHPPAFWLQTSGSTRKPKWVRHHRANVEAAAKASGPFLKPDAGHSWLLNLPLNHASGLGILLRSMIWGSAIRLAEGNDTESIAGALKTYPDIDTISLVPIQLRRLVQSGHTKLLGRLKNILIGGGGLSTEDLESVNKLKLPVRASYGMTETLGHFCLTQRASEQSVKAFETGVPLPGNEIQIRKDDGLICPTGESGQVWIRGPQLFEDYEGPDKAEFDETAWFHTGDFGYVSTNGSLFYEARRIDLIKTGGESVNPTRVELAIMELGQFADVAIIGLPDPEWGHRVHACLVKKDHAELSIERLRDALRDRLHAWELPKSLSWHKTLPRTELGKIRREALKTTTNE